MHSDRSVRPRWVWGGLIAGLAGAAFAGFGLTTWSWVPVIAGGVLLAAGAATALRGGVLYDTHDARPLHAELTEVRRGEAHQGTRPGDMVTDPTVRRDARETSHAVANVAAARVAAPRPGFLRASAMLMLAAAAFVLTAQGLYAHTALGQDNAVRDLGLAIVTAWAGLRLLLGNHPGRSWSLLAGGNGLGLLACAALGQHDATAGIVVEAMAGAGAVVAAALSLRRGSRPGVSHRGQHA